MNKLTQYQKCLLIESMQTDFCVLEGNGGTLKKKEWEKLTEKLNNCSGVVNRKTPQQWAKCWRDLRRHVKKRVATVRRHRGQTGGDPLCFEELTEEDRKIIRACGRQYFDEDGRTSEDGSKSIVLKELVDLPELNAEMPLEVALAKQNEILYELQEQHETLKKVLDAMNKQTNLLQQLVNSQRQLK